MKVHIVEPWLGPEGDLFRHYGWEVVKELAAAEIVCFTGGADINPALYGEEAQPETWFSTNRDKHEVEQFRIAVALKKPIAGICRGGQLACALSGGKLHQHVEKHNRGSHIATLTAEALPGKGGFEVKVTSMHHQMMIPSAEAKVLMTATCGGNPEGGEDIEALYYANTNSLCFQGHPEFAINSPCSDIFMELVEHYLVQRN